MSGQQDPDHSASADIPEPEINTDVIKLARCGMLAGVRSAFARAQAAQDAGNDAGAVQELAAAKDAYGASCMTWAVRNGFKGLTKFLVEQESDVETLSYGGLMVRNASILGESL